MPSPVLASFLALTLWIASVHTDNSTVPTAAPFYSVGLLNYIVMWSRSAK